jgi:hypothetical protein
LQCHCFDFFVKSMGPQDGMRKENKMSS